MEHLEKCIDENRTSPEQASDVLERAYTRFHRFCRRMIPAAFASIAVVPILISLLFSGHADRLGAMAFWVFCVFLAIAFIIFLDYLDYRFEKIVHMKIYACDSEGETTQEVRHEENT